ncbi:MAG: XRE family transcriptional regulator [Myxococcales bacterium]
MIFLGPNLRRLRKARGLTQQELAGLASVPRATLASMERDGANPGLEGVVTVARALDVSLDELVSPPPEHRIFKMTAAQAKEYRDDAGRYLSRQLSPLASRGVQLQHVRLSPGCDSRGRPHPMGAQEFFFCFRGTATLTVADEVLQVEPGALVQFPGHLPHRYQNLGASLAVEALSVVILA